MRRIYILPVLCLVSGLFLISSAFSNSYRSYIFSHRSSVSNHSQFFIKKTKSMLEIQLNLREMRVFKKDLKGFNGLLFPGLSMSKKEGLPVTPFKNFIIAGELKDLEVEIFKGKEYKFKNILPKPAAFYPCRCENSNKIKTLFKEDLYYNNKRSYYSLKSLGAYRGRPLSILTLYPAQNNREDGQVVFPELKLSLKSKSNSSIDILDEANFKEYFYNEDENNLNYTIISPQKFSSALSSFVKWKEAQGYLVHHYELDKIGADYLSVKKFLNEIYNDTKMNYVLLVGDEINFPTNYVKTSQNPRTPSDLSYFLMDGVDDRIPDVLYGRITASKKDQVQRQLDKIIYFEKQKIKRKSVIGIASNEGSNPTDAEYIDQMITPLSLKLGMSEKVFLQDNSNSSAENINKELKNGALWLNYIGHGSGHSWSSLTRGEYNTSDVEKISIQSSMPIIIDVACQNGMFSRDNRLGERFMNTSLNGGHKGATAYYGGSVDISWHPPAIMAVGINQYLSSRKYKTLGEILFSGQLYLISRYDDHEAALENLVWYHLLGDPSLSTMNLMDGMGIDDI